MNRHARNIAIASITTIAGLAALLGLKTQAISAPLTASAAAPLPSGVDVDPAEDSSPATAATTSPPALDAEEIPSAPAVSTPTVQDGADAPAPAPVPAADTEESQVTRDFRRPDPSSSSKPSKPKPSKPKPTPNPTPNPTPKPTPTLTPTPALAGPAVDAGPYGKVQVQITFANNRITAVRLLKVPDGADDIEINDVAIPKLVAQTLERQSSQLDVVSGATYTSLAYMQSLQAAIRSGAAMSASLVHVEHVWDTVISMHLYGTDLIRLEQTRDDVVSWVHHVDDVFSAYRSDSVLMQWQRGDVGMTDELREVLNLADEVEALTDGYFDVRWNGSPDPTGVVKGWAIDRAMDIAARYDVTDVMINAGGDVCTRGTNANGSPWRVGVVDPLDASGVVAVLSGHALNVATSGPTQRGEHIRCREPRRSLSASVTGPNLAVADALATAAIAAGDQAIALLTRLDERGWSSLLVRDDLSTWHSASWSGWLTAPSAATQHVSAIIAALRDETSSRAEDPAPLESRKVVRSQ